MYQGSSCSFANNTSINMLTVDCSKPQLIRRQTVAYIIAWHSISLVHSSWLQRRQHDISRPTWQIDRVDAVPVLVCWLLVKDTHATNTHSLTVLYTDVRTIVGHDTVVCTQHWCTWTLCTDTTRHHTLSTGACGHSAQTRHVITHSTQGHVDTLHRHDTSSHTQHRGTYKPWTGYRMVQVSMTLSDPWPGFQSCNIFQISNISKQCKIQ